MLMTSVASTSVLKTLASKYGRAIAYPTAPIGTTRAAPSHGSQRRDGLAAGSLEILSDARSFDSSSDTVAGTLAERQSAANSKIGSPAAKSSPSAGTIRITRARSG